MRFMFLILASTFLLSGCGESTYRLGKEGVARAEREADQQAQKTAKWRWESCRETRETLERAGLPVLSMTECLTRLANPSAVNKAEAQRAMEEDNARRARESVLPENRPLTEMPGLFG